MLEHVLPTPERLAKGDMEDYVDNKGDMHYRRRRSLEYHHHLLQTTNPETNEPFLTREQHLACENIIWLRQYCMGSGYRSIHSIMLPSEGRYGGTTRIERKYDAGFRFRFVVNALRHGPRTILVELLFMGSPVEVAAKKAFVGKKRVRPLFIEAAQDLVKGFAEIEKMENGDE